MQTCLHSNAFALPSSRHAPYAGSGSLPLFRDRLHQKCTATPSTSGRTLLCAAAPATLNNHTASAIKSKRGIKNNATELIGDTPMVRDRFAALQSIACLPRSLCPHAQVYLNKVNERCFARIACKLELMEPCTRYSRDCKPWLLSILPLVANTISATPPCSVKDRIAYNMINKAEEQGLITPGKTILVGAQACRMDTLLCL